MSHSAALLDKVKNLPKEPGVYRFLNKNGKIIYIGKAKNLRSRVGSYFLKGRGHSYRIKHMVERIDDLAYTVVDSEVEALLLENNLIKNNQPRYNILLKDGKTYPYICIKNERFPRVFSTRQKRNDGARYYGPYANPGAMREILNLIRGFVKLRTCNYDLSAEKIAAGKYKVCMEYQIGNCAGPCAGHQEQEDYDMGIDQIRNILQGRLSPVTDRLKMLMHQSAEKFEFERADYYKKKIAQVASYRKKHTVVSPTVGDIEVLTVKSEEQLAIVNHFKVLDGAIIQTHSYEMKRLYQESDEEIMAAALLRLMEEEDDIFGEIIVNEKPLDDEAFEAFNFTIPKIGDKKHLVELSIKNCDQLLNEKLYEQNFKKRKTGGEIMVEELQKALHMKVAPDHIECIDNSNFHGEAPVSSLVVFKDGKPSKRDYRHYNVKTVVGSNDFATMDEIVTRRMTRLVREGDVLPKLLVVDGGKGQLSSAVAALKRLGLYGQVPVIGIAKRLEEIYVPNDPVPLHIDKKSGALRLIQQMRDEAHRFAITHHRKRRAKAKGRSTSLTEIDGIGEARAKDILRTFKSIKKLKAAPQQERIDKLGLHMATLIEKAIKKEVI
ncbi:MAG: excinuclease ABC subunit UvrC [Bacteroidia bacterium]